jgi:hypothetical protein
MCVITLLVLVLVLGMLLIILYLTSQVSASELQGALNPLVENLAQRLGN